jgi:hypothetical protein
MRNINIRISLNGFSGTFTQNKINKNRDRLTNFKQHCKHRLYVE